MKQSNAPNDCRRNHVSKQWYGKLEWQRTHDVLCAAIVVHLTQRDVGAAYHISPS